MRAKGGFSSPSSFSLYFTVSISVASRKEKKCFVAENTIALFQAQDNRLGEV